MWAGDRHPPLSPIRGGGRIMRSIENLQRLLDLHPSPMNGVTLCQGNFTRTTQWKRRLAIASGETLTLLLEYPFRQAVRILSRNSRIAPGKSLVISVKLAGLACSRSRARDRTQCGLRD